MIRYHFRQWDDGWFALRVGVFSLKYQGKSYRWSRRGTRRLKLEIGERFTIAWGH